LVVGIRRIRRAAQIRTNPAMNRPSKNTKAKNNANALEARVAASLAGAAAAIMGRTICIRCEYRELALHFSWS
jgi:hypothetical protein